MHFSLFNDIFYLSYFPGENIIWNLYIHHADEDEGIATQWKNELENLGYKVRITADMKGGHSMFVLFSNPFYEEKI